MSGTLEQEGGPAARVIPKNVRQSVFDVLTCPICHEYMSPPITLCQSGHNICARCRPSLQFSGGNKCPRCRLVLLDTRNVALETIARGLRYPCRYHTEGCGEKFTMDEIGRHHARCVFRTYDCPLRSAEKCYWSGRLSEMKEHTDKAHSAASLQTTNFSDNDVKWDLSNADCYHNSHHVLFFQGNVLLAHKRFDIPHRKLCIAVQEYICGSDNQTFRYELQLEKNAGKQRALLSNVVHGSGDNLEEIFMSGDCMKVDFDMLMNFVKGTRTLGVVSSETVV